MITAPARVTSIACRASPTARSRPVNSIPAASSTFDGKVMCRNRRATLRASPLAPIRARSGSASAAISTAIRAETRLPSTNADVAKRRAATGSRAPTAFPTRAPAAIIRPIFTAVAKNCTIPAKPTAAVKFGSPSRET